MIKSIQHFEEKSIKIFEELEKKFFEAPDQMAEYIYGITDELHRLGLVMIQETLEEMDRLIKINGKRKEKWLVNNTISKQLITSLGTVGFKKTLYKNKEDGGYVCLLDQLLGIEEHERITEDAEANLLEEAVETSYRKGGENASLLDHVSRQTVKNKIHKLIFPPATVPEVKKVVDYLYIDADEDHVSLQFRDIKGDLVKSENNRKNNNVITKLVYVYEGVEPDAPQSNRYHLVNPYYFCCGDKTKDNQTFWKEIFQYLDNHYDLEKVKKIYLNADGGAWIKAGKREISSITYVLDEFHLEKYLTKMTSHMKDSIDDAKAELRKAIRNKTKDDFLEIVERLKNCETSETGLNRIEAAKAYFLENWMAAKVRLKHTDGVLGSSTEGHVSHILASRMSSRPMGWSLAGVEKMAQLRAYKKNHGKMLELVRYQKNVLPKAAGCENEVLSMSDVLASERNSHKVIGKYFDAINHNVSGEVGKIVAIRHHLSNI